MRFQVCYIGQEANADLGVFTATEVISWICEGTAFDGGEVSRRITSLAVGEMCEIGIYTVRRTK